MLLSVAFVAAPPARPAAHAAGDFDAWLGEFKVEARATGISQATLDAAFAGVRPMASILALERRQPERTLTFDEYFNRMVTADRIQTGRRQLSENRALLEEVGARFGVDPQIIVALWGIETSYGGYVGNTPVIGALTTLAFDGRRGEVFRRELLFALRIVEDGHITLDRMIGSWAGAMGQAQFMPTAFADYAVDFDGDGRKDIWNSRADVFASTANFLSQVGWRTGTSWGRAARLPDNFDAGLAGLKVVKPLSEWRAIGVRLADGGALPPSEQAASVVRHDGYGGPAYLVFDNFRAIMRWNRSLFFATAVGHLTDRIGE